MSVQQSLAAGLIGLVVAGAGAVGVYNFTTTGCFLGSCSTEKGADNGETAQVGLLVAGAESEKAVDACCPLGEGDSKLLLFIGAFTGWKGAVFALVAGSMQGLVVAIGAKLTGRNVAPEEHLIESLEDCCEPGAESPAARCIDAEGAPAEIFSDEDLDPPEASTDLDSDADEEAPRARIPFGPFLALGALEWVFFGDEILDWYLSLF